MKLDRWTTALIGILLVIPLEATARTWTDATGKFSVEAEFLDREGDDVRLRKKDGSEITVPFTRLSTADRRFVAAEERRAAEALKPVKLVGHRGAISRVAFLDNDRLISSGMDGSVLGWDLKNPRRPKALYRSSAPIQDVVSPPSGKGFVVLIDQQNGISTLVQEAGLAFLTTSMNGRFQAMTIDADAKRMAVAGSDNPGEKAQFRILQMIKLEEVGNFGLPNDAKGIVAMQFADAGKRLLVLSDIGRVAFFNVGDKITPGADLAVHDGEVTSLATNASGDLFAVGSTDGKVRVWDAETKNEVSVLDVGAPVHSLAMTADGKYLLAGGGERTQGIVQIWDVAAKKSLAQKEDHNAPVTTLAFDKHDKRFASGGEDKTILVQPLAAALK